MPPITALRKIRVFFRDHGTALLIAALIFVVFTVLYYMTALHDIASNELSDYSLSADVPSYKTVPFMGNQLFFRHSTTARLAHMFISFSSNIKLFFALLGALNVALAFLIFYWFGSTIKSVLCALIYGFSFNVWFFSSFPETHIVTVVFTTCFLFCFLLLKERLNFLNVHILIFVFINAVLNDLSAFALLLIPIIYYHRRLLQRGKLWRYVAYFFVLGVGIPVGWLFGKSYAIFKCSPVTYYTQFYSMSNERLKDPSGSLSVPLIHIYFFSVAAPEDSVSYKPLNKHSTKGYFTPSLKSYFSHFLPAVFLIAYLAFWIVFIWRMIRPREKPDYFLWALIVFLIIRTSFFTFFFNPHEAFLFAGMMVLPILLLLLLPVLRLQQRTAVLYLIGFLVLLVLTNIRFLGGYLPFLK